MTCYSPLKGFVDKDNGGIVFKRSAAAGGNMEVACGQCIGCRIDRSQQWAARIVHESELHAENCFITLTYDNEHLPYHGSLDKTHFQKFIKRLRKYHAPNKLRYFHCGEYGPALDRPHYHACVFGLDFPDRIPYGATNGIPFFVSDTLTNTWGKGFCSVGELNYQTAAYTARYIMKKITGARAAEHYTRLDPFTGELYQLDPEYVTMSLRPGIGGKFYEKYKKDFFPSDECPVPGRGINKKVPRYYENLLRTEDPNAYEAIKRLRKSFRDAHAEEYTAKRLTAKYKVKKAQLQQLKRNLT